MDTSALHAIFLLSWIFVVSRLAAGAAIASKEKEDCGGHWTYPSDCDSGKGHCSYEARWQFLEETDDIQFTVRAKYVNKWIGIGYSDTSGMPGTDAVLGAVTSDGQVLVKDVWISSYAGVDLDQSQDISNVSGRVEDGFTTISFIRKRSTQDTSKDAHFSDKNCLYMKFPYSGGPYRAAGSTIRFSYHSRTPVVSSERICIRSCKTDWNAQTVFQKTTDSSIGAIYTVDLKLKSGQDDEAPVRNTPEFQELANKLKKGLTEDLAKVSQVNDVILNSVDKDGDHLIARMEIHVKDAIEGTEASVEKAIEDSIASGKLGELGVDSENVQVKSLLDSENIDDGQFDYSMLFS